MTPNKARETARARLTFLVFVFVVLPMMLWAKDALASYKFQYNPEGSPVPVKDMEWAISYSLYAWTSRQNIEAEYIGTTGEDEADGVVVIQWQDNAMLEAGLVQLHSDSYLTMHIADFGATSHRLGYAQWWTSKADGSFVRGRIVLNSSLASKTVNKCLLELLVHEVGHIFIGREGHSEHIEDVMYAYRGECRYSLSLSDLSMTGLPLKSCHVERTPHDDLEYLDYQGKRVSFFLWAPDLWAWQSIYANPKAQACNGIHVAGREIWAEVHAFGQRPTVMRFAQESPSPLLRSLPIPYLSR